MRFEEEALALADQVYRVARRMVSSARRGRGSCPGHVCTSIPQLAVVHARARTSAPGCCASSRTSTSTAAGACSARPTRRRSRRATTTSPTGSPRRPARKALDQDHVVERLSQDSIVDALAGRPARLPRRRRARRHRRVQLRRRGADPRHPDRHRHVPPASWAPAADGRSSREEAARDRGTRSLREVRGAAPGYLDRELTDAEVAEAEEHLDDCDYCRRRYRFEESLRKYIRLSCAERMPAGPDGQAQPAPRRATVRARSSSRSRVRAGRPG